MSTAGKLIPVAKPWLDEAEVQAAARPILSGWVTQGPEVAAFEDEFADYVGARHACAVSSCTTALHLALLVAGVKPGDEVITVSHSYIASANSITYCGATPVFIDIQPETFNIDPTKIKAAITEKTRALLCIHQMGMPCDLPAVTTIAEAHNLPVIEDAACAIGSEIHVNGKWEKIGKPHGDITCFSFHPRKLITTGDGGMLTTSNEEWDKQFRLLRQHGMSVSDTQRHQADEVIYESYPILGYNYRMTDIQAAIGREQLNRLIEIINRRRKLADVYFKSLNDIPGLILPSEPEWAHSNWQSFCVRLPAHTNQREVMQKMLNEGVATRRGVMCVHRESFYSSGQGMLESRGNEAIRNADSDCLNLSESEKAQDTTIVLPLYHQITPQEQEQVMSTLRKVLAEI